MNHFTQLDTTYPGRLARILQSGGQAASAALQHIVSAWKRHQLKRQTLHVLHKLDARTLRDLGFDRSEIVSVVAEVSGHAEVTRARLMATLHRLPS